jgi:uroporphyrinogen decarboxylase
MNKIERVKAVLNGQTPDVVPAGFWFHYPGSYSAKETADAHIQLYRHTGMDVMKIMQDFGYPLKADINTPSDWYKVPFASPSKSCEFAKASEIIKRILDVTGGEAMTIQTMFGPFKAACFAVGDEKLMAHSKEDPKAVAAGVGIIAEALVEWANAYMDLGLDGIYYSAQFGEDGRFTREEWEQLVKPSDLQVLAAADARSDKYNFLHICGEPEYQFKVCLDRFSDYPGDLVNWSVKDNNLSLTDGKKLFGGRPILGGLNNKGNILKGTDEEIRREVEETIRAFGSTSMMLGADCTIQGETISLDRIRTAVEAAHSFCM